MNNFLVTAIASVFLVGFTIEAEAACGRSSCGGASQTRGKIFNGRLKEVLSRRPVGPSSCAKAPKVARCAECKQATKEVAPAKTDKK